VSEASDPLVPRHGGYLRTGPQRGTRRKGDPEGNISSNLSLVKHLEEIADGKKCRPAQIALAWLLARGEDVFPIPGTKRVERLEENAGAMEVMLTPEDLSRIDAMFPAGAARGERYSEQAMRALNR
jgi:aryl-alcohol dehydrogenase-like predicted oxidoreductase